ncbi:hypothetical protein [Streptomyces nodosus]|uniref:hypothetical protein n=1 Tax=Streptomyces nodosus TaxID=40318 RepID=UPI003803A37A
MGESTRRQTTVSGPVHLLDHEPPPEPTPGCAVCGALAQQRAEAERRGEWSRATDCSVEMSRHPHKERRR